MRSVKPGFEVIHADAAMCAEWDAELEANSTRARPRAAPGTRTGGAGTGARRPRSMNRQARRAARSRPRPRRSLTSMSRRARHDRDRTSHQGVAKHNFGLGFLPRAHHQFFGQLRAM